MRVAGKCPPETSELRDTAEKGFEYVELYLEKQHLEDVGKAVERCRNSELEVVSVHTPHVGLDESDYFVKADQLAERLNAYLVFHSQYLLHGCIPEIEKLGLRSDYGYENNPGISLHYLEKAILEQGHELVLDIAHMYMANSNFPTALRSVLEERHNQIGVIHLCDSTGLEDGLCFGEGEIDMDDAMEAIKQSRYDGVVVLEVMPGCQEDALKEWMSW